MIVSLRLRKASFLANSPHALAKASSPSFASFLGWCRSHEGASVAEKREAAKLIMEGFMQAYYDKAEFAPQ